MEPRLGYTEISSKCVIALRSRSGDYNYPDEDSEAAWPFSLAPRWMQVEAVGKVPDLIDKLIAQAKDTTKKLKSKAQQAYELAAAVNEVSEKESDWGSKLQSAMNEAGLTLSAEALAQPEVEVRMAKNELKIEAPKRYERELGRDRIQAALQHLGCPDLRFNVAFVADRKSTAEQAKAGKQ